MEDIVEESIVQEKLQDLPYPEGFIHTSASCIVYKSQFNGRYVVVKMKKYPSSHQRREAFNNFTHQKVVKLIHSFEIDYSDEEWIEVLVLEPMETDLRTEITRRREAGIAWRDGEILSILRQVVDALARAQEMGISHRGINPGNILKSRNIYKIAGFSCARDTTNDESTLVGSSNYYSPLQRKAHEAKQSQICHNIVKSDVYSLGLTILSLNYPGELKFSYNDLKKKPYNIIEALPYHDSVKFALHWMLKFEEVDRCDFLQLERYLRSPELDSVARSIEAEEASFVPDEISMLDSFLNSDPQANEPSTLSQFGVDQSTSGKEH